MEGGGRHTTGTPATELEALLEAERSRLADLLHDGPLSGLLAVRQDLEELDDPRLATPLAGLDRVIADVRSLTRAHHAELLADLPLPAAIGEVARAAARHGRAAVHLELDDAHLLAPHAPLVRSAVLELTTNAIRHGRARNIRIASRRLPSGEMEIAIGNDGDRIDLENVAARGREGHLGLVRLARRTAAAGGAMRIDADEAGGAARIVLRLPIDLDAARDGLPAPGLAGDVDPWMVVSADLRYLHVSDAMTHLVGYSRAEMMTTPPDERPWFADRGRAPVRRRQITAQTVRSGHHAADVTLRDRSGREIPTLATSHLLTRRPGDPDHAFLAMFRPLDGVPGQGAPILAG